MVFLTFSLCNIAVLLTTQIFVFATELAMQVFRYIYKHGVLLTLAVP
jgi:hypothetical protein